MKSAILLFSIFLFPLIFLQAQSKIHFNKKETIISVDSDKNSFTESITRFGQCEANALNNRRIYFGELANISNINARYRLSGKWKKIKKKNLVTQSVLTSSFYDGLQKTVIPFPKQSQNYTFEYSYKKTTSELIFLSLLDFRGLNQTDTFIYKIILPKSLK